LRESLYEQPKALAVIEHEFQRGARAVAKDVDGALKRVIAQALAAHRGQGIAAFPEIDRVGGQTDAALRGQLHHHAPSKKTCPKAVNDEGDSGHLRRSRAPSRRARSISMTCGAEDPAGVGSPATNGGDVAGCEVRGVAMCFLRALGDKRKCCATRQ
jgi:hypothetical protein